jgi:hypothetical protein
MDAGEEAEDTASAEKKAVCRCRDVPGGDNGGAGRPEVDPEAPEPQR